MPSGESRCCGVDVLHQQRRARGGLLRGRGAGGRGVAGELTAPLAERAANDGQVYFPHGQVSETAAYSLRFRAYALLPRCKQGGHTTYEVPGRVFTKNLVGSNFGWVS